MNSFKIISRNSIKRCFSSTNGDVTPLYDFHVKNGGKITNFGGYLLPIQYADQSIVNSHIFTRNNASIFDVSHMLQTEITGKNCVEFFETICTANIKDLKENSGVLTVFTNANGGILDDLIVTKITDQHLYIVSNAAMKNQDQGIIMNALEKHKKQTSNNEITVKFFDPMEKGLIALQGPKAAAVLQNHVDVDLKNLFFMNTIIGNVAGIPNCRITRCGYTGEDGFEISIVSNQCETVVRRLIDDNADDIRLAGLGARDSLRLEAGLCLYGSDITQETTPVDAGLTWLVAKRRRELQDFPGADTILKQIKHGSSKKRVGITTTIGPPPRHGTEMLSVDHTEQLLGEITSGCPSPTLKYNVAMGYVPTEYSKIGTKIALKIRNKIYNGVVVKMPFIPAKYYTEKNKNK